MKGIKFFVISIIVLVLTSSIKTEFDFSKLSGIMEQYKGTKIMLNKILFKKGLSMFLMNIINMIKQDVNIYKNDVKLTVDAIENQVNLFNTSIEPKIEEAYIDSIMKSYDKLLEETKNLDIQQAGDQIDDTAKTINDFISKYGNEIGKLSEIVSELPEIQNGDKNLKPNPRPIHDRPSARSSVHFIIPIIIVIILVLLFVWFLIRRKRTTTNNIAYVRQMESEI